MARREGEALLLGARASGEQGVVVSVFSRDYGTVRGLVRKLDGVMAGDTVRFVHSRRLDGQLGRLALEPVTSRAALMLDDMTAVLLVGYLAELVRYGLPEDHPYPSVYAVFEQVWQGKRPWWRRVAELEREVLGATGYGLSLADDAVPCAEGGAPCYVSPKSGRAVSAATAAGYEDKLLPLPHIWGGPEVEGVIDREQALRLTGVFLDRLVHGRPLEARRRLVEYLCAKG